MPEAEDVIVDAARHATAYAIDLWRRNCPQAPETPGIALREVRARLELLIEAALGDAIPIRVAVPPPPRSALSRLFERGKREPPRQAIPGTDGTAIFLPPRIDVPDADHALELYRILGLHQAARVLRGTARVFPWGESLLVQDLYLVSETAAVDAHLSERLPGLSSPLARLRGALLSSRASAGAQEPLGSLERTYRQFLQSGRLHRAPQPDASLRWARESAASLAENPRYSGFATDVLLGVILKPDALPAPGAHAMETEQARADSRSARLGRRPRARRAAEDEDDSETGLWMIQTTQPNEHVEDAMGLQRPIDKQPDEDLGGAAESVSELEELRLVSTPGSSRELFIGDDELPLRRACQTPGRPTHAAQALAYPEWDCTSGAYRERAAIVRMLDPQEGPANWVDSVLRRHGPTLAHIRRRFEALRSRRSIRHGEPEGEDIDLEAYVSAYSDVRARLPRPDSLYLRQRPARRDFSLLLLIDVSASTESWCGGTHRVIDLEKEALLIVATALEALRVRFAIQAFSGYGPTNVRVRQLKSFDEGFGRAVGQRVAALEPDEYTRAGAALRHATATLMHEPAYRRLLLLLSDGKPNDCDRYEGRYGTEDTRQALAEARLQGIAPFCLTVDRAASRYLPLVFGSGNYTIVAHPEHVTRALLEWLRSVAAAVA
jgi:nitric oxide reductase NorD protein